MNKQVLLINDLAGYGKVALSAMIPVLSHLKINIYNLPTALVSNTLDYGEFAILDTTDYMQNTLSIWKHLGFHYDAISTGFILHEKQASLIADYCIEQSKKGVKIFCDPIMGDDGKLYNGVNENTTIETYERKNVGSSAGLPFSRALIQYKEFIDKFDLYNKIIRDLADLFITVW